MMEPVRCEVSPSLWHIGRCTCAELGRVHQLEIQSAEATGSVEWRSDDDESVSAPIVEA